MIEVTCAIIRNEDDEILVVQRGEDTDHPLKWEFPGGKVKLGESYEECILREISEELSIEIVICSSMEPVEYDYGIKEIKLLPFVCDTLDELPVLSEHVAFKWIQPGELKETDFSEADIIVADSYFRQFAEGKPEPVSVSAIEHEENESIAELKETVNRMMSMEEADFMAVSAIENPLIFRKLFEYTESNDKKLAFRASWTLTKVHDRFPDILNPHLERVASIAVTTSNESVERSMLRIISLSDVMLLNRVSQGKMADHCFKALASAQSAIAIKAYAMEILYKFALVYPELGNELSASIRSLMDEGSAGIVSRGKQILKKISAIPLDR
jgi:8-oxo-dGTP diphosphatase